MIIPKPNISKNVPKSVKSEKETSGQRRPEAARGGHGLRGLIQTLRGGLCFPKATGGSGLKTTGSSYVDEACQLEYVSKT